MTASSGGEPPPSKDTTPTRPPRLRLTDRDRLIARFVARWGPVTQPQVARRADMSRLPGFRRLQALREAGYLHYERPVDELPGIFSATARGVELAGGVTDVAGPPAPQGLWPHLAAVDHAIDAELAGLVTATRFEVLREDDLRRRIPRSRRGELVAPRVLVLEQGAAVAVYAVGRPAAQGVTDHGVAMALESLRGLEGEVGRRVLLSVEVTHEAAVDALRHEGVEVVEVDPAGVGRDVRVESHRTVDDRLVYKRIYS